MEFSNNDLPERQWPSIVPAGADSLARSGYGSASRAGKPKKSNALITFCQAGHYTRLHYKQDVFA